MCVIFKKTTVGVAAAFIAVTLFPAANAADFSISGQINRAMEAASNGEDSDYGFVDNTGYSSYISLKGVQDINETTKAGFEYTIQAKDNKSSKFDINNNGDSGDFFATKVAAAYLKTLYGKFSLGKQSGAADGTSQVNYSGTHGLGGGVDLNDYAAGLTFLDNDGNPIARQSQVNSEFDGLSRINTFRYDSPGFGGFVASASADEGQAYELAGRYRKAFGDGSKFGMAVDFVDSQNRDRDQEPNGIVNSDGGRFQEYGGSASLLLSSGLNFTTSIKHRRYLDTPFGEQSDGSLYNNGYTPATNNYYAEMGYIFGKNHVALSYDRTDDFLNEGSKFQGYGLAYRYALKESVDLYAAYHLMTLDDAKTGLVDGGLTSLSSSVDAQNVNLGMMGVRIRFF